MAEFREKIERALNETRILMLGTQVLVGFQYIGVFESAFGRLPPPIQGLYLGALGCLLLALGLLSSPPSYHYIGCDGQADNGLHGFVVRVAGAALLPLALGLGLDLGITVGKLAGPAGGLFTGLGALLMALGMWYGLGLLGRARRAGARSKEDDLLSRMHKRDEAGRSPGQDGNQLADRIKYVLTEARVVLPGAQALLGFQFTIVLMESFDTLPGCAKVVHLISLAMICLGTVLLMTPAAYHRISEGGEDSEAFVRLASRLLLASMVPLALGLAGDVFVLFIKVTGSLPGAGTAAGVVVLFYFGLWFGYPLLCRLRRGALHSQLVLPS